MVGEGQKMTSPEYANRHIIMAENMGIDIEFNSTVLKLSEDRPIKVAS